MSVQLDDDRRSGSIDRLKGFFLEEFEEDLSSFRADRLLDFVLEVIGPNIYNQGVTDAQKFIQEKLDDLDGEVHAPEIG